MAEKVTIRHPFTREERTVRKGSVPFFVSQGFEVLDAAGRKKAQQPTTPNPAAGDGKKEH